MTTRICGRGVAAASTALSALALGAAPAAAKKIENSYICVFNTNVTKDKVKERADQAVSAQGGSVAQVYQHAIRGFHANISAQGVAKLKANNPHIAYCEQDQVMRTVSQGRPGGVQTTAQTTPWGITRVGGGQTYTGTGRAFVIDTGVDLDHPDLNVNTTLSRSFTREKTADDGNGHGTHVAGTIAAKADTNGVVGVAAGAQVIAIKVLTRSGSGSNSGVISGVDYVAANGRPGDVANMSLGGGVSTALDQAVLNAAASSGVKFALAAGNESANANTSSPGRVNGNGIFTVSAFANGDTWASFSNYGNPPVDFAEPGVSILSTYKDGGYATLSGTSMATPHLAGLLLWGTPRTSGTVIGDPDGVADTIGVR